MIKVYVKYLDNKERSYQKLHDAAWSMLHHAVYSHTGSDFTDEDIIRGEKGKPYFRSIPLHFGISHCDGCAVCAISDTPIGADCETIRKFKQRTAEKSFTSSELALISGSDEMLSRLWSLKESYVKFTGTGLAGHFNDVIFSSAEEYPQAEYIFSGRLYFRSIFLNGIFISVCSEQKTENIEILTAL